MTQVIVIVVVSVAGVACAWPPRTSAPHTPQRHQSLRGGLFVRLMALADAYQAVYQLADRNNSSTIKGCGGCEAEMPALGAIYRRFAEQGLVILAISTNTETANPRAFLAKHPLTFPVLSDPDGKVSSLFQVSGIPVTLVFDRSGKLTWQAFGSRTEERFLAALSEAGLR